MKFTKIKSIRKNKNEIDKNKIPGKKICTDPCYYKGTLLQNAAAVIIGGFACQKATRKRFLEQRKRFHKNYNN